MPMRRSLQNAPIFAEHADKTAGCLFVCLFVCFLLGCRLPGDCRGVAKWLRRPKNDKGSTLCGLFVFPRSDMDIEDAGSPPDTPPYTTHTHHHHHHHHHHDALPWAPLQSTWAQGGAQGPDFDAIFPRPESVTLRWWAGRGALEALLIEGDSEPKTRHGNLPPAKLGFS